MESQSPLLRVDPVQNLDRCVQPNVQANAEVTFSLDMENVSRAAYSRSTGEEGRDAPPAYTSVYGLFSAGEMRQAYDEGRQSTQSIRDLSLQIYRRLSDIEEVLYQLHKQIRNWFYLCTVYLLILIGYFILYLLANKNLV